MNDSPASDSSEDGPIWAVVANVVFEREFGEEHEPRSGTKHLRPGAKVHIVRVRAWENRAEVVGRQRKSGRIITIWTRLSFLANPRVELVYHPILKDRLAIDRWNYKVDSNGHIWGKQPPFRVVRVEQPTGWDGSDEARAKAEALLATIKDQMKQQPFATRPPQSEI